MTSLVFTVREYLDSLDCDISILEPSTFDVAIMGLVPAPNGELALCYDTNKVLAVLRADGMAPDEARDYFEFNIENAHVGPNSPVFLDPLPEFVVH